jgi:mono/diheme cytochrome c family protein
MKFKSFIIIFAAIFCLIVGISFTMDTSTNGDPWDVPAKFETMKNPITVDKESRKLGKKLYNKHCKSCHGKAGLGDGSKAAQLDTPCGDFTEDEFHSQSDGAIFYKTIEGRDDMPGFKKKLPEAEDVWSIINYIRTFE